MRGRFAFVEYESRRDADDAYHEMHNKRIGRDDLLKIEVCQPKLCNSDASNMQQWARTPPSASWRFDSGRDRPRAERGERSERGGRGGDRSPRSERPRSRSPRRSRGGEFSPRKDDRRERDYDRRDRDRSRSPDGDRDREMKDVRDRDEDRERDRDAGTNGEERNTVKSEHPIPENDDLL
jgi:RNA recognition motif-containing protein